MTSLEEIELNFRNRDRPNFPGYSAPIEFRPLRKTDGLLLTPVFRNAAKSIRTYLSSYQHSDKWWLKDTQAFVTACVNEDFPAMHFLFTIGEKPVALGSLHSYADSPVDVQIVLAVFGTNQSKGIGTAVAETLKQVAFQIWGFSRVWWIVDATNRSSMAVAQKIGCEWDSTFEEEDKYGERGSGLWNRFVVERPLNLPDGVLQGAPVDYWQSTRSAGMLEAVIESRQKKRNENQISRNASKDSKNHSS